VFYSCVTAQAARKEYNDTVRELVSYVKKVRLWAGMFLVVEVKVQCACLGSGCIALHGAMNGIPRGGHVLLDPANTTQGLHVL
jgi:hypothetical protein